MKAAQRNGVILLMIIALGGIIAFQVYWINTALDQSKIQFERNVRETLVQVVDRLEEKEASRISAQTFVFFSDEPSHNVFVKPGNSRVTIKQLPPHADSDKGLSYVIHSDSVIAVPGGYDVSVQRKLEKKVKMVDVAVNRILMDEKATILDRIDSLELDSLLASSLREKGIHLNYEYAVYNSKNSDQPVIWVGEDDLSADSRGTYRASLFPNDLDGSSHFLSVYFPSQSVYILRQVATTLVAGLICIGIILGCFIYTLRIISRQKKLSQIKNDFINNMTHELKTPIATISLATEVLSEREVLTNPGAIQKYLSVIRDENSRLSHQVERVLQSALLENRELQISREITNFHILLADVLETFESVYPEVELTTSFNAKNDSVAIDIHHITNVINNLLDNAVKYSAENCRIRVSTETEGNKFILHVKDNGIGMDPKQIASIFDSFYRIPTGNLHDVKGFGLGLSYVRHIVELHEGKIDVQSGPGKGSDFIVQITNAEQE